jgi:hypothetical protein
MSSLKYENGDIIEIKIDYQKENVKFVNGTILDKTSMFLKEFAIDVLRINPETKEFLALYIGKEVSEAYNKHQKDYILTLTKSKKNMFVGTIQKIK